jgi:hypothetical protein
MGTTQQATVHLGGLQDDLELMVLSSNGGGCDPGLPCGQNFSANSQNQDEEVIFQIAPGTTYYIVVDGYNGAESPFTLTVSCP